MTKVLSGITTSVDGYIAGPDEVRARGSAKAANGCTTGCSAGRGPTTTSREASRAARCAAFPRACRRSPSPYPPSSGQARRSGRPRWSRPDRRGSRARARPDGDVRPDRRRCRNWHPRRLRHPGDRLLERRRLGVAPAAGPERVEQQPPAVDRQHLAGDVARRRRGEEQRRLGRAPAARRRGRAGRPRPARRAGPRSRASPRSSARPGTPPTATAFTRMWWRASATASARVSCSSAAQLTE